jgi:hypothetical protein
MISRVPDSAQNFPLGWAQKWAQSSVYFDDPILRLSGQASFMEAVRKPILGAACEVKFELLFSALQILETLIWVKGRHDSLSFEATLNI